MSISLLKKSMAIVEQDLEENKKSKEKQIGIKKKGIYKHDRSANDAMSKSLAKKKTIDDIRKELQSNTKRADDNVKKLLSLSKQSVKIKNAEKIIERAHKGRYYTVEEEEPVEQESVFTEEDFLAFEQDLAQTI